MNRDGPNYATPPRGESDKVSGQEVADLITGWAVQTCLAVLRVTMGPGPQRDQAVIEAFDEIERMAQPEGGNGKVWVRATVAWAVARLPLERGEGVVVGDVGAVDIVGSWLHTTVAVIVIATTSPGLHRDELIRHGLDEIERAALPVSSGALGWVRAIIVWSAERLQKTTTAGN